MFSPFLGMPPFFLRGEESQFHDFRGRQEVISHPGTGYVQLVRILVEIVESKAPLSRRAIVRDRIAHQAAY